jgi:hypothetical protein
MSNPYPQWLPDPQYYAVEQERYRHDQAINTFGEYAMFVLLWDLDDLDAGRVQRCRTCYTAYGKIADVYGQAAQERCPDCYGTTFEGGYKAKIVRQSLWVPSEEEKRMGSRGEDTIQNATIQTPSNFLLRTGDYVFRADGTRWRVRTMTTANVLTGFWESDDTRTATGYEYANVNREDESSVAYIIPPDTDTLINVLDVKGTRYPVDFSAIEEIHGPLMPV